MDAMNISELHGWIIQVSGLIVSPVPAMLIQSSVAIKVTVL
jgi:hypothetical protein